MTIIWYKSLLVENFGRVVSKNILAEKNIGGMAALHGESADLKFVGR